MTIIHPRAAAALEANSSIPFWLWDHASFAMPICSPREFADALKFDPSRIAKTVLLARHSLRQHQRLMSPAENYAAVCIPAPARMNFARVGDLLGWKRAELATVDELKILLGYPSGAVSPLGIGDVPLFADTSLLAFQTILVGSGIPGVEIEIEPQALAAISNARLADILMTR